MVILNLQMSYWKNLLVRFTDKKTNQFGAYLTMNYAYDGKYVVNFSVRLDASNRFGRYANENFNPVWAGGLRWNVSRETWFNKQNIVSDLSLRFSYGYQRNMATNYSPSLIVKVPTGSASEITDQNTEMIYLKLVLSRMKICVGRKLLRTIMG